MSMTPFVHVPEDFFDCGGLGEHEIELTAFIEEDYAGGKATRSVNITRAVVKMKFKDQPVQEIDVTKKILDSHYTRQSWEDEIYKAYKAPKEREWDEVSA